MRNDVFFHVNVKKYRADRSFEVVRPASINKPRNNAVMFIMESHPQYRDIFLSVENCLIFWPSNWEIPAKVDGSNAVVACCNPHGEYCRFFRENKLANLPQIESWSTKNGYFLADTAVIGDGTVIFPGAYIGGEVIIGKNCYIGAGTKLLGQVEIGDNVVVRENTVIGADGLTTDRDEEGHALTMPQFGGVLIEDNVQVGANSVIARGAIDDTVLHRGCKVDNFAFISHNVHIGKDSFIVGNTLLFGSSSVGERTLISGNCAIGNYVSIGDDSILGMGSIATKSIPNGSIAYGCPAKVAKKNDALKR